MPEQNWSIILSYLYNNEGEISYKKKEKLPEKFDIVSRTELSPTEIENTLEHMADIDLVDSDSRIEPITVDEGHMEGTRFVEYSLSKNGFRVAHEREMNQNQQRTNVGIGILTIFLVIGSMLQGYSAYLNHDELDSQLPLMALLIILIVFSIMIMRFMTGHSIFDIYKQSDSKNQK